MSGMSTKTTYDSHSTIESSRTTCLLPFTTETPVHTLLTTPEDFDYCEDCHGDLFLTDLDAFQLFPCYYCGIFILSTDSYLCSHCRESEEDTDSESEESVYEYTTNDDLSHITSNSIPETETSILECVASHEDSSQETHEYSED